MTFLLLLLLVVVRLIGDQLVEDIYKKGQRDLPAMALVHVAVVRLEREEQLGQSLVVCVGS